MFRANERIFIPGSSGTPVAFADEILASPGLNLTTSFVPGVNEFAGKVIGEGTKVSGFFMQPALTLLQRGGTYRHLPLSYAAVCKWFNESEPFDTCIVQTGAPDNDGNCSLGPSAEFTPLVMRRAGRIIAVINQDMPYLPHAPKVRFADCAKVLESSAPIVVYNTGVVDAAAKTIAAYIATLVHDGAVLQLGLGKIPAALCASLVNHRNLRFHTGMLSDGMMALETAGALDMTCPHKATVVLGSELLYRWVAGREDIIVAGCDVTHNPLALAAIDGFTAINSALEVDLFGQCNLEWVSGRAISGAGGAPDFAHAAKLSRGGLSIIALPATFAGGTGSRIKPVLGAGAIVSLPRTDVDILVTEQGIADLRGKSVNERAEAIIEIAVPALRASLRLAWRDVAAKL